MAWVAQKCMAGKKDKLSSLLFNENVYPFTRFFWRPKRLNILAYHRVCDFVEATYPFDTDLISASVQQFETQLRFLSRYCNVITFKDLSNYLSSGTPLPERTVIITFDDGFSDNYHLAFPLLKKYGLRAVFYLSTDYIDTKELFWFELLAYLGKKDLIDISKSDLAYPDNCHSGDAKSISWQELRAYMIKAPNSERLQILNKIKSTSPPIIASDLEKSLPLKWEHVSEMVKDGMEFGSHTQSHLVLGNGTEKEIENELYYSKKIIEDKIGDKIESISYPIAAYDFTINDYVLTQTEQQGYNWGVSYFSGTNNWDICDRYKLKRLKVERYTSFARFKGQLFWPGLMAY